MTIKSEKVKLWRVRTKKRIIESMGGKCVCCGYDKYSGAMELHHIDPSTKKISFGGMRANPISWNKIVAELRKCVLVCANCHREIEGGILKIPKNYTKFNETFLTYNNIDVDNIRKCKYCKLEYSSHSKSQRYCSNNCFLISRRRRRRISYDKRTR